jgi:hypothetical protein
LKLCEGEGLLESFIILIPLLTEMKEKGTNQMKTKSKKILNILSGEGIDSN